MKKYIKYILFFLILLLITIITLFSIISDDTIIVLKELVNNIKLEYIFILLIIVSLYFILQGIYMKVIFKSLGSEISFLKGTFYAMIEFYFSGITPSSSGGQPVQLYFITKDKIPPTKSIVTLILNTIYFKIIIVLLGMIVIIFNNKYIFNHSSIYTIFFFIGLLCDCFMITFWLALLFNKKIISKIINFLVRLLKKIPFIRKYIQKFDVNELIDNYSSQSNYIKKYPKKVFYTFILTFIQRLLLFSVAYFVYRGLGYNDISYFELIAIQITVQMTIEMFPIPGGALMSETMLRDAFTSIFGIGIAEVGMLFTRAFAFYIPLIVCFIIIMIIVIKNREKYLNS